MPNYYSIPTEYLEPLSKAGGPPDVWSDRDDKGFRFHALAFSQSGRTAGFFEVVSSDASFSTWARDKGLAEKDVKHLDTLVASGWRLSLTERKKREPVRQPPASRDNATKLLQHKEALLHNVDRQVSKKLNDAGVVVGGVEVSTSLAAQAKWTALHTSREVLSYPIGLESKTGGVVLEIQDAEQLDQYYKGYCAYIASVILEASDVKKSIRSASSAQDASQATDSFKTKKKN